MDTAVVTAFLDEVCERVDPAALLQRIGYATDKIQAAGDSIKAFCPIHKDTRFRSLLVDSKKHTFKCTIKTCPGYSGGNMLDLYAQSRKIDLLGAAVELVGALDLQIDSSWNARLASSLLEEAERAFVDHQHDAAESAAAKVLQFQPSAIEARLLLANIYFDRDEKSRACDEFMAVIEHYLSSNAFEEADRILASTAAQFPDSEDLLFLQVRSAELQGRQDQVGQLLEQAAKRREESGRLLDNIGVYERLVALRPNEPELHIKLGDLCEMRHDVKRGIREWEKAASLMIEQGNGEQAVPLLEKIVHLEPESMRYRMMLADEFMREGEYEKARQQIFDCVDAQIEQSDFVNAATAARKWLDVEPESIETHAALARIYQEQGLPDESVNELQLAAKFSARDGADESALEFLFRAKFVQPENVQLRREIIDRLKNAGQKENAAFELLDYAELHFERGDEAEGENALREAAATGESLDFRLQVAAVLQGRQRTDAARDMYLSIGQTAEEQEVWDTALNCYDELLNLDPANMDFRVRRCRVLWESALRSTAAQATAELVPQLLEIGDQSSVMQLLGRAAEAASENPYPARTLFHLSAQVQQVGAALRFYAAAAPLLRQEDPNAALDMARQALALRPDAEAALADVADITRQLNMRWEAADAYVQLAEIRERRGDLEGAMQFIDLAAGLNLSSRPDLLKRRAQLLGAMAQPVESRHAYLEYLRALQYTASAEQFIGEYSEYLQGAPGDSEARREYADALGAIGRPDEAKQQYLVLLEEAESAGKPLESLQIREQIINLDPGNLEVRCELAKQYAEAGDVSRAVPLLLSAADGYMERGDMNAAAEAASAAVHFQPDNADALEKLAVAERNRQNFPAFEECAGKLVALGRPGLAIGWWRQNTQNAANENRLKEAEEYARRWSEIAPSDPDALEQTARIYRQQQRTQRAVETYIALAEMLRGAGDLQRAAYSLRQALEVEHDNVSIRQTLWQVLLDAGREEEAIVEMQQLSDILIERRAYKDAATLLSRILDYRTNSVDTLQRLASLVHEHEGFAKALPYFKKLLALRKQFAGPAEVIQDYEGILRLEGADVEISIEFAEYLDSIGDKQKAKHRFLHIAQVFRDEMNDPQRAIEFFTRSTAIAPGPEDARVFEELTSLYLASNSYGAAAASLRELIRMCEAQEDDERAISAMRRLTEIPDVATVHDLTRFGDMLSRAHRSEEAAEAYRMALEAAVSSSIGTRNQRRTLCEKLLEVDPLNFNCAMALAESLTGQEAATRAAWLANRFAQAGKASEQARLLEFAKGAAPQDLNLRYQLIVLWRAQNETDKLRQELLEIAHMTAEQRDFTTTRAALDEISALPLTPELGLKLGPIYALCNDPEKAAASYCNSAESLTESGDYTRAAAAIKEALNLDASSVAVALVASLVRKSEGADEVRSVAHSVLDAALLARSRTRALVVGAALLEVSSPEEGVSILQRIFERAGAAFVVAVGGAHADWLLEKKREEEAVGIAKYITSVAQTSPDAWWLAAQLYRKCGNKEESAAASLKAARFFSEAGAVTEEEICYRETLEEYPDDAGVLQTLAFFYERERRLPDAGEMMKRLANIALKENNEAGAIDWLQKAGGNLPDDQEIHERLLELLLAANRAPEAVAQLFELGRIYSKQALPEKTIAAYEQILVHDERNWDALQQLIDLAIQTDDLPRLTKYSHRLSDLKAEAGALKQACHILKVLLEKNPQEVEALQKLAQLSQQADDEKGYCTALRGLGQEYVKRGEHAEAVQQFETLLERRPDDHDVRQMLIDCYSMLKMPEKAANHAEEMLKLSRDLDDPEHLRQAALAVLAFDTNRPAARRELAEALCRLGELEKAASNWLQAADQFQASKDVESAMSCLRRITEIAPNNTSAWKRYAEMAVSTGDTDSAQDAYFHLADAFQAQGDIPAAEAIIAQTLSLDPDDPITHARALTHYLKSENQDAALTEVIWLTSHHVRQRNYAAAEAVVQNGLELDPQNSTLHELHIGVLEKLGRTEEIEYRLQELAEQLLEKEEYERALKVLERLKGIDSDLPEARGQLAMLYARSGQADAAAEEFLYVLSALFHRSEFEEAREVAEVAAKMLASDMSLRARIADMFAEHHMPDAAARYFASCAATAKEHNDTENQVRYLRLAVECRPRWPEGLQLLVEACSVSGRNDETAESLQRLAPVLIERKQLGKAAAALRQLIALRPKDPAPRRQLVEICTRMGDKEGRVGQLKELSDLLVSRGQTEEAVDVYRQIVGLRPDDTVVLHRYTELFSEIGNDIEILDDYMRLADAFAAKGALVEATRTFEKILTIDRRNSTAREKFIQFLQNYGQKARAVAEMLKLAGIYTSGMDCAAAVRTLSNALSLDPHNPDVCIALADVYELVGNREGAAKSLLRAAVLLQEKEAEKATAIFRRVIDFDARNFDARKRLCDLLIQQNAAPAEIAPNLRKLAEMYSARGEAKAAEDAYELASKYEPESVEKLQNMIEHHEKDADLQYLDYVRYGDQLTSQGMIDKALEAYRKARDINDDRPELIQKYIDALTQIAPENEAIPDYIAIASRFLTLGDHGRAGQIYEHVLRLDPGNPAARLGKTAVQAVRLGRNR